jgi:hypothetical protein
VGDRLEWQVGSNGRRDRLKDRLERDGSSQWLDRAADWLEPRVDSSRSSGSNGLETHRHIDPV